MRIRAAALFARALTASQALTMLTQRGLASEARATCRNILEEVKSKKPGSKQKENK
jgi:hypothetical protein